MDYLLHAVKKPELSTKNQSEFLDPVDLSGHYRQL